VIDPKIMRPTFGVGATARRVVRENGVLPAVDDLRGRFLR
jgi:hypothetical protein